MATAAAKWPRGRPEEGGRTDGEDCFPASARCSAASVSNAASAPHSRGRKSVAFLPSPTFRARHDRRAMMVKVIVVEARAAMKQSSARMDLASKFRWRLK